MKLTEHYNLKKPEGSELVGPDAFNDNSDIVDNELKRLSEAGEDYELAGAASAVQINLNAHTVADNPHTGSEPKINAGTDTQYLRGNKTWSDFFTNVRSAVLTGLSTATNAVIAATDTVLAALGKLQAQITAVKSTADEAIPKSNIAAATGGTLAVARGGTGKDTLATGEALVGAATGAVTTRPIKNNTATSTALVANTELVTQNTLRYHTNRLTSVAAADTGYTTCMARGIVCSTTDLTPGTSALTNGTIYLVYE